MTNKITKDIMSPAHHVNSNVFVDEARRKVSENNIHHYPVTDGKNIIGLLSNKILNF
jgi:CBS domain-containing protein